MQKIKLIKDALQAISKTETDHNLVMTVLLGLPEDYRGFTSALNTHGTKATFEQLCPLLMQEETKVQHRTILTAPLITSPTDGEAFFANRDQSSRGGRGGRYRGGQGQHGRRNSNPGLGSYGAYPHPQSYPQPSHSQQSTMPTVFQSSSVRFVKNLVIQQFNADIVSIISLLLMIFHKLSLP